jgi:hypothetical protein
MITGVVAVEQKERISLLAPSQAQVNPSDITACIETTLDRRKSQLLVDTGSGIDFARKGLILPGKKAFLRVLSPYRYLVSEGHGLVTPISRK